jgi:hypothetical protein
MKTPVMPWTMATSDRSRANVTGGIHVFNGWRFEAGCAAVVQI